MPILMPPQKGRRAYRSDLRAAQAERTRRRVLDALKTLVKAGQADVSIAALARAARVSLPTMYRHFPTRLDLFEAYRLHVEGPQAHIDVGSMPVQRTAVAAVIREFFGRFDAPDDPLSGVGRLRAPLAWEFSREITVPRRQLWAEQIVAARAPRATGLTRKRLVDLLVVLVSSSMGEAFRGYLRASGAQTADRVVWAVEALLTQANRPPSTGRRTRIQSKKGTK
jgi:AcrR family transcriptional regulator